MNMDGFTQYLSSTPQYPPQTPSVRTILFPQLNTRLRVLRYSTSAFFNHAINISDQLFVLSKEIKMFFFPLFILVESERWGWGWRKRNGEMVDFMVAYGGFVNKMKGGEREK